MYEFKIAISTFSSGKLCEVIFVRLSDRQINRALNYSYVPIRR